jgi:phospho-N-acetylmuramoyl-pentapeptide-transferase
MKMERVVAALTGAHAREVTDAARDRAVAGQGRALFNVFNYITLRAVLPASRRSPCRSSSALHDPQAHAYKIGQAVRDDGPRSHLTKAGTPTMGGALILVSIVRHDAALGRLSRTARVGGAARHARLRRVGWVDDYRKVVHRNPKGLSAKAKLFWQSVIGSPPRCYLGLLAQSTRR